jgi:serine/threonine-protein kinase
MRRDLESIASGLPAARSLSALVGDQPEVSTEGSVTERVPMVATTATQTLPRVERTRRRRGRRFAGIALLLVAIAAAAWGAWIYVVPHHADVPRLIGSPIEDARAQLIDIGFHVVVADVGVYRMNIPLDSVAGVDPKPGTSLEKGATVTLVRSLGPKPVRVPNLRGKTIDEARSLLEGAHLTLALPPKAEYSDQPVGVILRVSTVLVEGKAPRNSAIEVMISRGPAPVKVPNVLGATLENATLALVTAGFVASDPPKMKFSTVFDRNTVIKQTPAGGRLQPGETISLVVSLGPKHFPAPDFRGLSRDAAQALADQFGIQVTFSDIAAYPGTTVRNQSVAAGTTITYGDPITLYMV